MRAASLALVMLWGAFAASTASADCIDYGGYIHQIGHAPAGGQRMAVWGDWAFLSSYGGHFTTVDIRDPEHPRIGGILAGGGEYNDVAVFDTTAYVSQGDYYYPSCIKVIDVADPGHPRQLGTLGLQNYPSGITISWPYAYVEMRGGLVVLDITEPQDPQVVGTVGLPGWGHRGAVLGSYLFVAVADFQYPYANSGLRVFDIRDPTNPVSVGFLHTPENAFDLEVSGTYAYLAAAPTFYVVDISDPSRPAILGDTGVGQYANAVSVSGVCAYIASQNYRLKVIDVSDPRSPHDLGTLGGSEGCDVAVSGNHAFIPTGINFQVVDITNPKNPPVEGFCEIPAGGGVVAASTGYAFVSNGTSLYVVTIDKPSEPKIVGSVDPPGGYVCRMDALGRAAYLAQVQGEYAGVRMIDVSDPENPRIDSWIRIEGGATDVFARDAYVYVAAGSSGLRIIDFAYHENPRIVGGVDAPGYALGIAVSGNHAFLAASDEEDYPWENSGLWVIDITDPESPVLVGGLHLEGQYFRDVAVFGGFAYASGNAGLHVIDISDPEAPYLVGQAPTMGGESVAIEGTTAYVTGEGRKPVEVVDIRDPIDPRIVGESMPISSGSLTLMGSLVLAAAGSGLHLLPTHCGPPLDVPNGVGGALCRGVQPVPNPTRGPTSLRIEVSSPGPVRLALFDPVGRCVRKLLHHTQCAGTQEIAWDGRDEDGRRVAAGIYIARVSSPGGSVVSRIAVIR